MQRTSFHISELPKEVTFKIKEVGKLAKMTVSGDVDNSWAYLEMTLSDPEDQPLFQVGREIGYYTGYGSDGRWSEGSQRACLTFRPEVVGIYTVGGYLGTQVGRKFLFEKRRTAGSDWIEEGGD